MDAQEYARRDAELAEQLAAARAEHKVTGDRVKALWDGQTGLMEARLAALTDEEVLADEGLLRWLLKHSCYNSAAYDRARELQAHGRADLYLTGVDGRDEYASQGLPLLCLILVRDQSVTDLAPVVRDWYARWALGREEVPIDIMERSASQNGSWAAYWKPATDEGYVRVRRYGQEEEKYRGPLIGLLDYVARNAWCKRTVEEWGDSDDD